MKTHYCALAQANMGMQNHRFPIGNASSKVHFQGPFSIAMLVYQRVSAELRFIHAWGMG